MINSIIQAFLYTSKFIIGGNGNLDLYYFFSICVIFYFLFKKPYYLKKVICVIAVLALTQIVICISSGIQQNYIRNMVTIGKLVLDVVLMYYVSYSYKKWNVQQFINLVSCILFVETIFALVFSESILWRHNDVINVYSKTRLQLLYIEPSELSLHCGFLLILILIQMLENGLKKIHIVNIFIVSLDLILTAGMSGIACLAISIILYVLARFLKNHIPIRFIIGSMIIFAGSIIVLVCKKALIYRIISILNGTDGSLYSRFSGPSSVLLTVLKKTNYMGLGAGMLNTQQGFDCTGLYYKFPNSIMYFIAEFGVIGIIALLYLNYKLFKIVVRTKKLYLVMPWIYVMVFQIIGGYYTNPFFWLTYGIILSYGSRNQSTLENKI